ncbi:MAG: protein-L-isoaspartate O-methyltransferase [Rhodospirillaceae bacterium]
MVDTQIRTNKVTDERVLRAMAEIPREDFVPPGRAGLAYIDEDIDVGNGRFLLEPMVFARMLQAAAVTEDDFVLNIGCGTGYSAMVLGRLARAVVALESDPAMARSASENLSSANQDNVVVEVGPLVKGWPDQAPYDLILFSGAVEHVPDAITAQLVEGGRLCAIVRRGIGNGSVKLMVKAGGAISGRTLFDASSPVLAEFELEEGFTFR